MTKLSKTYLGFRPGSRPGRAAGRRDGVPRSPPPSPARPAPRWSPPGPSRSNGQDVGRAAVVGAAPVAVAGLRPRRRLPPQVVVPSPRARRGRPAGPAARRPVAARGPSDAGRGRPAPRRPSRSQGGGADGVGPDAERAAAVVGPVPAGPVLLGALRLQGRLGRRPRPAGGLVVAVLGRRLGGGVLELDGDADVAAELLGQRLGEHPAHPGLEHGLGELVGRGEHRGVLDQPQRAGQVQHRVLLRGQARRQPLADLVPDRRQVQRGIGHAVSLPMPVDPWPLPVPTGAAAQARWIRRPVPQLWTRGRTGSTPVSTGCARPATGRAGPRAGSAADRHLCWSAPDAERENGRYGGRLTDGVGPRAVTLTSNAERRRR